MKSWADHCSSDEESFNEDTPMEAFEDDDEDEKAAVENVKVEGGPEGDAPAADEGPRNERTYDFPAGPPYTLFVGNLSYGIKDGDMLAAALDKLVEQRLKQKITVVKGRIGGGAKNKFDNKDQAHKGFGYVEVGSLEDVSKSAWQCICFV